MQFFRVAQRVILVIAILISAVLATAQAPIQWKAGGLAPRPTTSAPPGTVLSTGGTRHVVVQFGAVPDEAGRDALAQQGLTLQSYLGDNAYFALIQPQRGTGGGAVVRALEIDPAWKTHPLLLKHEYPDYAVFTPSGTSAKDGVPKQDSEKDAMIAVYAIFHADADALTAGANVVQSFGGQVRGSMRSINGLVAWLPLDQLDAFIAHDSVQWVEPPLPPLDETNNSNRGITEVDTVNSGPYNLSGDGVTVLVYDGGFADASHPDFGGRLTVQDTSGLSDHATHVAGTIGGSGANSQLFGGTANQWRGMATDVVIKSYGFEYDGSGQFLYTNPGDLEDDYDEAINTFGAMIANNSIGTNVAPNGFPCAWEGDYGATSQLIDAIVAGSLGAPMRVIWANGNERGSGRCGTTYNTTAPPAGAKNHITVGAMHSNNDAVTSFTSWGPTDDGRMKPDISAPGCQSNDDFGVTSTVSGGGYDSYCGTSMASPTVTGICALLLQDYMAQFPGEPLPRNSTLKVLLAQNAVDLGNVGPDYQTGFGSVRAQDTIDFMRGGQFLEDDVSQGGTTGYFVTVAPGSADLKVTIAWDDPPGAINTVPELVNDLDLVLVGPDGVSTFFPWTLDPATPSLPAVRTQADRRNNIEQVLVDAPAAGVWEVRVLGFAVPQGPQIFSLAASAPITICSSAGTVSLDRSTYACSSTATIRVVDCDLNVNPGAVDVHNVTIASTTEAAGEVVALTETDINSAQFVGTIALDTTASISLLQVADGDLVEVTYDDADTGSGPAVVTAQATVDCVAPTISNVYVLNTTSTTIDVVVETDELTSILIEYGLSCGAPDASAMSLIPSAMHQLTLTSLLPASVYYFTVVAEDAAGNSVVADNNGTCYSATTMELDDRFTQQFQTGIDLAGATLTLTPDGSPDYYEACIEPAGVFPTDPSGGAPIVLGDDDAAPITLSEGIVSIYDSYYSSFWVGSNGYVTFDDGDTGYLESLAEHFELPRISALFDDLNPAVGGSVSWKESSDHAAITFQNVPEYSAGGSNNFQIQIFFDGRIAITWLGITCSDAICGISEGNGIPNPFLASDISGYSPCALRTIGGTVTQGGLGLANVRLYGFPSLQHTDESGHYSATVPLGWSGTVTPTLAGYDFFPGHRTYTNVGSDLTGQDYIAFNASDKVLNEDFESGPGLFTPDPTRPGLWHRSAACEALDPSGHSASTAFFYGVDGQCDYDAGATAGGLLSPAIDAASAAAALLQFSYYLYTEGGAPTHDVASVKVIPDGGPPVVVASNDPTLGVPLLADPSNGWQTLHLDLTPFAGGSIQLCFDFDTVDAGANHFSGFYVDDVMFYADAGTVPVTNRIHVDKSNVSGTEDGLTWATAFTTIQEGVDAATLAAVPYVWVRAGTYDEPRTSPLFGVDSGSVILHGGVALYGGFDGTETDFSQRNWGAHPTIIDGSTSRGGGPAHHVLFTLADATIDGFTVQGGNANAAPPGGFDVHNIGGGMLVFGGSAILRNTTFANNGADFGGAVGVSAGHVIAENAAFSGNAGITGAGGIFCFDSMLDISGTEFTGNSGGYSGAVDIWLNASSFETCTFSNNSGTNAGAVFAWGSTPEFLDCSFLDNEATLGGGAGFNFTSNTTYTRCIMNLNQGVYGGALSNWSCTPVLTNCLITNSTGEFGGAVANIEANSTFVNCTIADNTATTAGGAMFNVDSSPIIVNSILWNDAPGEIDDSGTSVTTAIYSIIQGGWSGGTNLDADPLFVGGSNYGLQGASPAVDTAAGPPAPPDDIDGTTRPQGAGVDRGAYESH